MELSKGKQKNYRMVFWNLAGLSLVESLLMRFVVDAPQLADSGYMPFIDVIVGLGFFALIVFWCINFQQACKKIGKKSLKPHISRFFRENFSDFFEIAREKIKENHTKKEKKKKMVSSQRSYY
jgi:hypothetical protein